MNAPKSPITLRKGIKHKSDIYEQASDTEFIYTLQVFSSDIGKCDGILGIYNSSYEHTVFDKMNVFCQLTDYTGINTTDDFCNNRLSCNNLSAGP